MFLHRLRLQTINIILLCSLNLLRVFTSLALHLSMNCVFPRKNLLKKQIFSKGLAKIRQSFSSTTYFRRKNSNFFYLFLTSDLRSTCPEVPSIHPISLRPPNPPAPAMSSDQTSYNDFPPIPISHAALLPSPKPTPRMS